MYLSFYCNVCVWEVVGDRAELQYIDPHSDGRQRCVFLVLQDCSTGGPGPALCWMIAFFTASYHQLVSKTPSGVPRAPSAGCGCLYHILSPTSLIPNSIRGPNSIWLPVLTELYNSSTSTQSPTQSLEWHVWSSSSGNNCNAVQRSLSSGASVYECIMGFLPGLISSAKSDHATSLDYWPLKCVTSFRCITLNGIFGRVEGQNTTHRTQHT